MMDKRTTPFSGRVAHVSLRGQVAAETFTEGHVAVTLSEAAMHSGPDPRSYGIIRELLMGDEVTVLEERDGMAFVVASKDGYVGWVASGVLTNAAHHPLRPATHIVHVRQTLRFSAPDIKASARTAPLAMGARVHVTTIDGRFAEISAPACRDQLAAHSPYALYFVPADHLRPLDHGATDPVALAEQLIGTPYRWGGNSSTGGIDCSGLVQLTVHMCNTPCPADSDMQEAALGATVPEGSAYQRGDLLFWKGHVAWVADPETLIHANAFHMAVAFEPIQTAIDRIMRQGDGPVTRHARLPMPTPLASSL